MTGGSEGGRRLRSAKGLKARPTSDRVRESLFGILGRRVLGVSFLDLFAGTGAVGIEALSRGAARSFFVEKDRGMSLVVENNLLALGLAERGEVLTAGASVALTILERRGLGFEIVFLDPPYQQRSCADMLGRLDSSGLLVPGALVVAQHHRLEEVPSRMANLGLRRQERYGETVVSFYSTEDRP